MIVEFLGQGLHFEEDETCGNHICSAIKNTDFSEITMFVAFIRTPGLIYLKPFIENAKKENRKIVIYAGIDERVTSKEALELLLDLDVETYIYFSNNYIFHPKVYLFEGNRNRIIIGSSNLTKSGLFYNVESSLLIDFSSGDSRGQKILKQIKEYYSPLLDFSDPNLELLTLNYLNQLVSEKQISSEKISGVLDYNTKIHDFTKRRNKSPKIPELGTIEISETRPLKKHKSTLKITEDYLEKWDYMFGKMTKFYQENNHCTVPREYKDRPLYVWYRKQKLLYNSGIIPQEHIDKLKSINFYFGDAHTLLWERKWLNSFNQLLEIYNKTGDCNIKRYKNNQHPLFYISNWVAMQRGKYRRAKLEKWQIEKLEEIGFQWEIMRFNVKGRDDDWLNKLALLEDYKNEYGDCNISQNNSDPKYYGLGKWLNDQRNNYKKKNKILTKERIDLLEGLGIVWDMRAFNFERRIQELIDFKEKNGNFDIPANSELNPSLSYYIYKLKTNGVKEEWKKKRLKEIGFYEIGTIKKRKKKGHITKNWYDTLKKLKELSHPNIAKTDTAHPELAKWLEYQRKKYRNGKLKTEQIEELKKLGITLPKKSKKSRTWQDYIEIIELFREEYGEKEITAEFDPELYNWVKQQEANFRTNGLRKSKIQKLIELKVLKV